MRALSIHKDFENAPRYLYIPEQSLSYPNELSSLSLSHPFVEFFLSSSTVVAFAIPEVIDCAPFLY